MKKILKGLTRILPAYGIFPVIFSFVFNCLVYSGSRMIAGGWYHHNIETAVDRSLPFVPQFLIIYFGCYLFWAVNYILIARQDRHSVYQFFTGDFISRCICLGFFLLYPTTNTRPVITDGGLWNQLALWLYSIDAADNLFRLFIVWSAGSAIWVSAEEKKFRYGTREGRQCWQFLCLSLHC